MKQSPVVIASSLGAIPSGLVATASTFCCVGPAVIAVLGMSGALAAAQLAPQRPYFIVGSVPLLVLGFWLAYRPQGGGIGEGAVLDNEIRIWYGEGLPQEPVPVELAVLRPPDGLVHLTSNFKFLSFCS